MPIREGLGTEFPDFFCNNLELQHRLYGSILDGRFQLEAELATDGLHFSIF